MTLPRSLALAALPALLLPGCTCDGGIETDFGEVSERARDDDDARPDDDDAGPDDDDAGDDDDAASTYNPCGELDVGPDDPPVIDFGGPVGELAFERPANCEADRQLRQLFAGWVDGNPYSVSVLATLVGTPWPTMGEFEGFTLYPEDFAEPMVLHLDTAEAPHYYVAPAERAGVHLMMLDDGVSFAACVFDHGGTWTHTETGATVEVPDPLEFVCEER